MMPESIPPTNVVPEEETLWSIHRIPAGCPNCRRVFLITSKQINHPCPFCRKGLLERQPIRLRLGEPEQMLPFTVKRTALRRIYEDYTAGVWIKPEDFNLENLLSRITSVFWPMWLVDSEIEGCWRMEAGFDYQVESSQEVFSGGEWVSRKQIEDRVRWESRAGEIKNRIENVPTPALEEHRNRRQMTGVYPLENAQPFNKDLLGDALIEVPDLPPEDAWEYAKPQINQTAGQICAKAAGAQHFRNFALRADYQNLNWTELLLPLFATYYLNDDNQPQIVLVNGQTGKIQGPRLASRKRGLRIAGIIAGVGSGLLLLALIGLALSMVFPPAGIAAALLGVLGFITVCGAILPAVWPGQWNRKQNPIQITEHK